MSFFEGILNNTILISALAAWIAAGVLKMLINLFLAKEINLMLIISSGGFPSSHSAVVSALAVGVGKNFGWDSSVFAIAAVFGLIVLHDAIGIRRAAGKQAVVLNQLVEQFYRSLDFPQERLKELIGHTPLQVFGGVMLGIIVGVLI